MGFLLASFLKDLRRLADPMSLAIWIGVPLLIGGLMSLISGGQGGIAPKAHVLLVDQDDSFLSHALAGAGGSGDLGGVIRVEKVDEREDGRRRIDAGEASALVVIPNGFGQAVLREEPVRIEVVTNPAQRILPRIVRESLSMLSEVVFYVHRLIGEELLEMTAGPPQGEDFFADSTVASFAAKINERMRGLQSVLFPPILSVESEVRREDLGVTFSFATMMLPAMLLMALLFVAQGVGTDIWREHEGGTLRRVVMAPAALAAFLAGKVLAAGVLMAAVTAAGLAIARIAFGVPIVRLPLALLWCTFAGIVLYALFLLVQLLASSARGAGLLGMVLLFPLMMIGGSFFPFEAMPEWMARIGRLTPNGVAVLRLKDILGGNLDPAALLESAAVLGLPAALALVLSIGLIRRRFAGGQA